MIILELTKDELELVDEVANKHKVTKEKAKEALLITKQIVKFFYEVWCKVKQTITDTVRFLSESTGLTEGQVVILISNRFKDTQ